MLIINNIPMKKVSCDEVFHNMCPFVAHGIDVDAPIEELLAHAREQHANDVKNISQEELDVIIADLQKKHSAE